MQLKDFAPPIIVKLVGRAKGCRKQYNTYQSALAMCKNGYNETDLINVVYEKTKRYRDSITLDQPFVSEMASVRTLIGLGLSLRSNELNVVDFGGACGFHYFIARQTLGKTIQLRWHVVETASMVAKAHALEDGQLRFFDDLQEATSCLGRVDLIFSSCAIQYVPDPYALLERLVGCGSKHLFLTRGALSPVAREMICIEKARLSDNGPGVMPAGMKEGVSQYPVTYIRKDRLEDILTQRYSIDAIFNEDKAVRYVAGRAINMYGHFCSLKE